MRHPDELAERRGGIPMSVAGAEVRERLGSLREQLAASAEWRLLSLLLSRPRPGWHEEVSALAVEVGDPQLRRAALAARDATEGAYHALLGAGGPASPREAAHAGFADPGRILSDLALRYAAFGFAPRAEEADDHLAVECGFVSYLLLKEAYALAAGREEAAAVTREERTRFLAEHAAVAARGVAGKLPAGSPEYLVAAAAALASRLPAAPTPESEPEQGPLEGGCPGMCS
jgi:nitrate reductase assembly molybdenum cofactor insertion protein NarJ